MFWGLMAFSFASHWSVHFILLLYWWQWVCFCVRGAFFQYRVDGWVCAFCLFRNPYLCRGHRLS